MLTQPPRFSARVLRTEDLPADHAGENTVGAYLERLFGSARGAIPCPDARVTRNLKMFILQKRIPQICLMTYSNRRQQSAGPRRTAADKVWKPQRRTITALCAIAFC